ncbi:MAG: nucleoside monophosphate kinase [Candidatus Levybacteria bacterium]|nr:nucleoside monophosphate kinase [Candidatus Levybacteria bacterium]
MTPSAAPDSRVNFIFISGRPGGGKDTQAEMLAASYPNIVHINPGAIFRKAQNPLDAKYGQYYDLIFPEIERMNRGEIIDMATATVILTSVIDQEIEAGSRTFAFAGMPRTAKHFELVDGLTSLANDRGLPVRSLYLYLAALRETSLQRISIRREGGALAEVRADDSIDAVARRLDGFEEETKPAIKEALRRAKSNSGEFMFRIIRGDRDPEIIHQQIAVEIDRFFGSK